MSHLLTDIDNRNWKNLVNKIYKAYNKQKTIFFIGNGGSASTASHFAADLGKNTLPSHKYNIPRFKAFALTDNVAWMTALGNDISYEDIFIEQLKNFAAKGDLVVFISGSGNSKNLINTARWASKNKLDTLALLGFSGGKLIKFVDTSIVVKSDDYGLIESMHSFLQHCLIEEMKIKVKKQYGKA